ncbi:probable tyrosyl-DNA phosphodiesterase [Nasonia vitripennis]|uniref:PBZ-type domain-containing protein n=1 Tax=Nasonia vitripennis TaxID=7425 RepID=A0A7M7G6L9_NASVI|nr:probable tyrosyl-DNA phosphodiesterase [Nasonia vitripennis]
MNSILKDGFVGEKNLCPYKEKCYRKNPVHFTEMAHPHLEKLVIDQLDEAIMLPNDVGFECPDRSQLLDQLKVLQMVLKKEREKSGGTASSLSSEKVATPAKASSRKTPKKAKELENLKAKIEKHKQVALQKRESKLMEMDAKAAKSDNKSDSQKMSENRKRASPNTSSDSNPIKKAKSNEKIDAHNSSYSSVDSQSSSSQSSSSQSSIERVTITSPKSYIENFVASNDRKLREKIRDQAVARMRQGGQKVTLCEPGEFALKYALSAPYHYFFNKVEKSKVTHEQQFTVSFPELLDISLGEIVDSLHINFMVEIGWLCLQYLLAAQNPKMTIFCGSVCDPNVALPSNITLVEVNMPAAFGCHHSKISVFKYSDGGIRIVVSTANIYSDDWENRTQGLWMSPHLPPLPNSANPSDGESPTNFKKSFREYLNAYRNPKLVEWENLVKRADCSAVNVFFVASIPGSHKGLSLNSWGHRRLAAILNEHAVLPPDAPQWTIIAQSSSIGNLGPTFDSWIQSNIVFSLSREKAKGIKSNPNFHFVYPSLRNYEGSFDCKAGSCCLPYSRKSHEKQEWLKNYLYQWKADETGRTKAMPHVKSYTRISPDLTQIPWFVLTSANLSKGAWGTTAKTGVSHYIMNYEAGVVFIPKFVINQQTFPIKTSSSPDIPVFRLPYDLPLTRYRQNDVPFVIDFLAE